MSRLTCTVFTGLALAAGLACTEPARAMPAAPETRLVLWAMDQFPQQT
jgi:hypothetical protein